MNSSLSRKSLIAGLAGLGMLAAVPAEAAAGVAGAWKLETFDVVLPGGQRKPQYGPNPIGYLLYTPSGKMSAVLQAAHRATLNSKGDAGSPAECTQSVETFLAYAGHYEIRGNRVFHHVETSVFTNLVGTTLEREFHLSGDTLTIRTIPPYIWSSESILLWRRA